MNKHSSKDFNHKAFTVFSLLSLACSGMLLLSLLLHRTSYFTTVFHLADPSLSPFPEVLEIGIAISAVLFGTLLWAYLDIYRAGVLKNSLAYDAVLGEWEKLTPGLITGSVTREHALAELSKAAPQGTRLGQAIASWQDASPSSDPEYVIEGIAAVHRGRLNSIHIIASILILIGLMGNFFGLNHAVGELPEFFSRVQGQKKAQSQVAKTTTHSQVIDKKTNIRRDSSIVEENPAEEAPGSLEGMKENVRSISQGLSVVVTSSVLGILGMIWLLACSAWLRGMFATLVTEEITLAAAEIYPALMPSQDEQLKEQLTRAVGQIADIPEHLKEFKNSTELFAHNLSRNNDSLISISEKLEQVLVRQLEQLDTSYQGYQKALGSFIPLMQDSREQAKELADTAGSLYKGLADTAGVIQELTAAARKTFDHHNEMQATYDRYLKESLKEMAGAREELMRTWEEMKSLHHDSLISFVNAQDERAQHFYAGIEKDFDQLHEKVATILDSHNNAFAEARTAFEKGSGENMKKIDESFTAIRAQLGTQSTEIFKENNALLAARRKSFEEERTVLESLIGDLAKKTGETFSQVNSQFTRYAEESQKRSQDQLEGLSRELIPLFKTVSDMAASLDRYQTRVAPEVAEKLKETAGRIGAEVEQHRLHFAALTSQYEGHLTFLTTKASDILKELEALKNELARNHVEIKSYPTRLIPDVEYTF